MTTVRLYRLKDSLRKAYKKSYIKSGVILLLDILIGILSAEASLLLGRYLISTFFIREDATGILLFNAALATFISSLLLNTYKQIFRFALIRQSLKLMALSVVSTLLYVLGVGIYGLVCGWELVLAHFILLFVLFIFIHYVLLNISRWCIIFAARWILEGGKDILRVRERVLIFGVHEHSAQLARQLEGNKQFEVAGFCDRDEFSHGYQLDGKPIYPIHSKVNLSELSNRRKLQGIIFPAKRDFLRERESFIHECEAIGLRTYLAPDINVSSVGTIVAESVHRIRIEDLLMREVISHDNKMVKKEYSGKTILVTGAAGSIGSELVHQIAHYGIKKLVIIDNAETPLHNLRLAIEEKFPNLEMHPVIADVRERLRLEKIFEYHRPDIVLHAAAYKHVPLMEENPCESITVNVEGTRHVADCCVKYGAEKMVMISTDKAVNPTNVMGACKRAAEIYVQSLGKAIESNKIEGKTKFITTRFGNVLGSQGSVIHLFREQIAKGGPITVTDPEIVRYFMSIPEACSLVLEASSLGTGTQIFVFDMGEKHKIVNLAKRMIKLAGLVPEKDIKIEYTGLRPGEKLYEEVLATDENTLKTDIPKVCIALVREFDYNEIIEPYTRLCEISREIDPIETVKQLKQLVPEYKSANSRFALLD